MLFFKKMEKKILKKCFLKNGNIKKKNTCIENMRQSEWRPHPKNLIWWGKFFHKTILFVAFFFKFFFFAFTNRHFCMPKTKFFKNDEKFARCILFFMILKTFYMSLSVYIIQYFTHTNIIINIRLDFCGM